MMLPGVAARFFLGLLHAMRGWLARAAMTQVPQPDPQAGHDPGGHDPGGAMTQVPQPNPQAGHDTNHYTAIGSLF